MSGNILFLGNKIFEIPPFFQTRPGDLGEKVHACSLRFSALNVRLLRLQYMDQGSVLKGITSKKERRLSQNADVLGVCLVAKHAAGNSTGTGQYKTWTADCGPRTADWV